MKTEALNKCLNIFLSWRELEDNQRHNFMNIEEGFAHHLIEPFRRELAENMVSKTPQEQRNLIIFYVNEIDRVSNFVQDLERTGHEEAGSFSILTHI